MGGLFISLATGGTLMDTNKPLKADYLEEFGKGNTGSRNHMEMEDMGVENNPVEPLCVLLLIYTARRRDSRRTEPNCYRSKKRLSEVQKCKIRRAEAGALGLQIKLRNRKSHSNKTYVERRSTFEGESSGPPTMQANQTQRG